MEYQYSSSGSSSFSSSEDAQVVATATPTDTNSKAETTTTSQAVSAVRRALLLVQSDDVVSKLEGAREIRRLTKTSQRCRRLLSDSVGPLIAMLRVSDSPESNESALLALLNLAVRDEMYALSNFFSLFYFYFYK